PAMARSRTRLKPQRVAVLYSSLPSGAVVSEKIRRAEDLSCNATGLSQTLQSLGHQPQCLDFGVDPGELVGRLSKLRPDVVFNFAEAPSGSYAKEPHAVALLELLGLPYTGNGPLALATCKNKALTKDLLRIHGIATPRYAVQAAVPRKAPALKFPLVVKP